MIVTEYYYAVAPTVVLSTVSLQMIEDALPRRWSENSELRLLINANALMNFSYQTP